MFNVRSVAENVFVGREPGSWLKVDRKRMESETAAMLESLGIRNLPHVRELVVRLSGGQRQAVAIARAVSESRTALILDEPTAALGIREVNEVLSLVRTLKSRGIAIMMVSHNLAHVFEIADDISVMRGGRAVLTKAISTTSPEEIVAYITGIDTLQVNAP